MRFYLLILVISIASCSTSKEDRVLAWESWKGRPVAELSEHPYFKSLRITKLKHKDGPQTWIYKDQSKFQTGAYCQSLGGCMGMPIYNCDNAFSVKDEKIIGFEQSGSCPDIKVIKPQDI